MSETTTSAKYGTLCENVSEADGEIILTDSFYYIQFNSLVSLNLLKMTYLGVGMYVKYTVLNPQHAHGPWVGNT